MEYLEDLRNLPERDTNKKDKPMTRKITTQEFELLAGKIAVYLEGDKDHPLYSPCKELFHDNLVEYFKAASAYIERLEDNFGDTIKFLEILKREAKQEVDILLMRDKEDREEGWELYEI